MFSIMYFCAYKRYVLFEGKNTLCPASISCGNTGLTASFFVFSLQYLFDNGRVDDVFSDQYYTRFAHSLHQILDPWRPSIHPLGVYKKTLQFVFLCNQRDDCVSSQI